MHDTTTRLALGLGLCLAASACTPKTPWIENDWRAAMAEAEKTGKPIFAVVRCER